MAGMDYASVAYCKNTKKWTNIGYIRFKAGLFCWHKWNGDLDCIQELVSNSTQTRNSNYAPKIEVHQLPSQSGSLKNGNYKCIPGIASVVLDKSTWVFLFGYYPEDEVEYLLNLRNEFQVNLRHKKWSMLKQ